MLNGKRVKYHPMRKLMEVVSLIAIAVLLVETYGALYGPNRFPEKIPTHFDLAGTPDGWGSSSMLLLLPGVAVVLYLGMSWVSRFPESFHYPVRVSAQNRLRLQGLAMQMIVLIKAETVCVFALLQHYTVQSAHENRLALPPLLMPCMLGLVFLTVGYHFRAMRRCH